MIVYYISQDSNIVLLGMIHKYLAVCFDLRLIS